MYRAGPGEDRPDMTQVQRLLPATDVRDLREYEAGGGGQGLEVALRLEPPEVTELVRLSGLRGRGGAGFPTGTKWKTIVQYASTAEPTPVVVNAAEGEPGTFKDRMLMRRNPYLVLEGALIAARAIGSPVVVIAAKASFTVEIDRLHRAIEEMRQVGWLDGLTMSVVPGPSHYLFGEETGLLEVLEGRQPFPRVTPPWRRGLDADDVSAGYSAADVDLAFKGGSPIAPALIDNVETLANVPLILANGVDWYRSIGTERSPGSILCTVTGATRQHGVGEFALGTMVSEVIETVGGGAREDHEIRAVLSGVASAPLPAHLLDTPMTYEDLAEVGSGLGSASFIVIDETVPVRRVAADVARFLAVESCGQCVPCKRDSIAVATELLEPGPVDEVGIADRLSTVADGSRCALAGQTEVAVAGMLALADWNVDSGGDDSINPTDLDLMAIAPLVDIIDGEAVLDLTHRDKAPDWSHGDGMTGVTALWPVQRLADQPVEIDLPSGR